MLDDQQQQQIVTKRSVYSGLDRIGKYLIHGFVFSAMMLVAEIVLGLMLTMLIIFASLLGLIIWFGLVFLVWGWINGMLCSWLWGFEVKQHWTNLISHGFAMFLVLLIVGIPVTALLQFVATGISSGLYISIQLACLSVVYGVIGKAIGGMFKESHVPVRRRRVASRTESSRRTQTRRPETCPFCGAVVPYRNQDLSPEGTAPCRRCGRIIQDPRYVTGGADKPQSAPQN